MFSPIVCESHMCNFWELCSNSRRLLFPVLPGGRNAGMDGARSHGGPSGVSYVLSIAEQQDKRISDDFGTTVSALACLHLPERSSLLSPLSLV